MRNSITFTLLCLVVMFVLGCSRSNSNDDVSGSQYSKTYITGYLMPDSLTAIVVAQVWALPSVVMC